MFTVCQILPVLIIVKSKSKSQSFSGGPDPTFGTYLPILYPQISDTLVPRLAFVNIWSSVCSHRNHPSLSALVASLCSSVTRDQWKETWARRANTRPNCRHHHHNSLQKYELSCHDRLYLICETIMWQFLDLLRAKSQYFCADWLVDLWSSQMDWKYTGKCPECHAQCGPRDRSVTMLWQLWRGQPPSVAGWGHVDWINN